jgi:uncharacterized membrane protein
MIMYTSAAASAAYYVFGLIPMDYGLFFFCFGFCCTAIVRKKPQSIKRALRL